MTIICLPIIRIVILTSGLGLILFASQVGANENDLYINLLLDSSLEELMDMNFSTASKYKQNTSDAPSVSTIITSEEIERFGANSLFEVIERVTSVYMTGSNFFPQNVMAMRGTLLDHYDNHILILLNGRPVRESYAGGVNFAIYNAFPINIIERLEIIRGPDSVLYGTNAYSGVVNIITKKPTDNTTTVSLATGSYSAKKIALSSAYVAGKNKSVQWGVNYFNEDGWDFNAIDNNGDVGAKDFGEDNFGGFISAELKSFQLNAFYVRSDQDFIGASASWSSSPPVNERFMASDRLFIDIGYKFNFRHDWYLHSNITYGEMAFDHYNYIAFSNDTSFELTNHWQVNNKLRWIIGATVWNQDVGSKAQLRNAPVPDFTSTWYSFYSQIDYQISDDLKFTVGGQLNKVDNIDADVVPRLGAIYKFTPIMGVKLMYAEAFRAAFGVETGFNLILKNPDGSNSGGLRGNPLLSPETIKTSDIQLFFNDKKYQLAATVFYSELENLVTRERAVDNVFDFINEGRIESQGFELEAKMNVTKQLYFVGNYSYQGNENGDGVKDFTTVPNNMIKTGFIYYLDSGSSIAIYDNYIGEATDIAVQNPSRADVNPKADSYHLVTANVIFDLRKYVNSAHLKGSKLEIYAYNLFDHSIYSPDFIGKRINTLPARSGRAVYAKFSIKF